MPSINVEQKNISQRKKLQNSHLFLKGSRVALPIAIGYFPIAVTFGMIAVQSGLSLWHSTFMSIAVFAGASQFMAASMVMVNATVIEIIVATFVLNFRHFIMSMSFINKLNHIPIKWKALLSFGITDETFSVFSLQGKEKDATNHFFILGIFATAYVSWIAGTLVGGLFSSIFPPVISQGMSVGLYAMFIALVVPVARKSRLVLCIVVISMVICTFASMIVSSGWAIVIATLISSLIGVFFKERESIQQNS
ncbi:AzlC family ABC transporter permease [Bacillus sp. SCS-151]|uniref:AzlC family ABC transporter permease n=1 Tax=Nanhaiella sioensis TaxID=3115293 RepID=UPI00397A7E7E